MLILWTVGVVVGLGIAVWASSYALEAATDLGAQLGLSPFVIGVTIVAVGTDLPEIANSIIASSTGHGDLNVGDSIGSVVTQATVVLGVVCLLGGLRAPRGMVLTTGVLTVFALLLGAALFADQHFGRVDGAVLIALWVVGTIVIKRPAASPEKEMTGHRSVKRDLTLTAVWLAGVGVGATLAVESFTRIASSLGAPEFLLSFFVLSLGTSLPELVVAAQAVRRSESALALGDVLGSCFVDATLSPGIGPLLFPTTLSAGLARTSVLVAIILAIVTALLIRDIEHRWTTGVPLLLMYLLLYPALIS
ncbi:MAG: cation:H+ antiporter [Acidimicrobiales bacterium]